MGLQPCHDTCMQHCIEVEVPIIGLLVGVLLDGGSNMNMVSPEFTTVAMAPAIKLQEQMMLQLTVTGSHLKINYVIWVPIEFGPAEAKVYFNITNIEGYDAILGTLFLWEFGVSPIYSDNGWIMRDGKYIHFPSQVTGLNPLHCMYSHLQTPLQLGPIANCHHCTYALAHACIHAHTLTLALAHDDYPCHPHCTCCT